MYQLYHIFYIHAYNYLLIYQYIPINNTYILDYMDVRLIYITIIHIHILVYIQIQIYKQQIVYQNMQVVTDPQNYQTSEVVQKSSKSGIFSNKRLLVIKNGFLYYFTNVPKNYKYHVPNILSTFKQLPKSSIEIKTIQQIKMESSNSTNLIIKFYEKDMIQRQDIRKSLADQNYRHTKKNTDQLEEWKFTYAKVLNCRLWYTALLKLKAYFAKQEDKIQEFFNNFDPVKRNSLMPTGTNSFGNNNKNFRKSSAQINLVSQFKQEDKRKQQQKQQAPPSPTKQKSKSPEKVTIPIPVQPSSPLKKGYEQHENLQIINEDEQIKNKKLEDDYRQQIQQQIRKQEKKKNAQLIEGMSSQLQAKSQKIKLLEQAIKATQKLRAKEQQARAKQRQLQRERQRQIEQQLQRQRQRLKQAQQRQYRQQQEHRQKQSQQQRQQRQQRQNYKQNNEQQSKIFNARQSIITPLVLNERRSIQLNQFSVQTDQEDDQQGSPMDSPKYRKRYNESYLSGFASTQRDTFNLFRNAGSLSFELEEKDKSYENYDYYTEVQAMQSPEIKFDQRIKKQIKLINYVKKMKDAALDTFKQYIDANHPTKSVSFAGTLFEINIVCSHGKIINIEGKQKLVYSNQEHQRLKRQFKLYNELQDRFIVMAEKRKKFPLRVPLCFFFEYMGYSGLLKYMPYLKPIYQADELRKVSRYLRKIVQQQHIQNYQYKLIANRLTSLYMIIVKNPYKITKSSQFLQMESSQLYGPQYLLNCRNKLKCTNTTRLQQEIQKLSVQKNGQSFKKMMSINQAMLCRYLKNLYRSTQPFSFDQSTGAKTNDFLGGFLSSPEQIKDLVSSQNVQVIINGLLISYIQYFFGIRVSSDFDIYNTKIQQISCTYEPLCRMFSLNSLYPHKLLKNLSSYISSQKYQLVYIAFDILSQLDRQDYNVQLYKIKYQLKRNINDEQNIRQMIKALTQIRQSTSKHNTIWLECYMLAIQCQTIIKQYEECLKTINQTLEYVGYMYGPHFSEGETEDYLYLLVAQTLAKMGNHHDSMSVYTKLLDKPKSSLSQQQISLSIAQVYSSFAQVDPHTLIQFLLSLINKQTASQQQSLTQSFVKKSQSTPSQPVPSATVWQSNIRKNIGLLYKQINNIDLCVKYLQQSLLYYQQHGVTDQQGVNNLVQICLTLFNSYQLHKDKSIIFSKFIYMIQINSKNEKFSVHIVRMTRAFVTSCFCYFVKGMDKVARMNLAQVLEQLRDGDKIVPQFVHLVTLEDVEKTILKLSQRGELGIKEAKVMQLVDISQIQIYNISLG